MPRAIMRARELPYARNWDELPIGMTPEEAAKVLRTTPETVRKKCRDGEIKAVKIGDGGGWIIAKANLRRMLEGE